MADKGRPLTIAEKNRQKALENKEHQNSKLESKLLAMGDKEVTEELKKKGIPTFGTKAEREQRLRKAYGLGSGSALPQGAPPAQNVPPPAPVPAPPKDQGQSGKDKTVNEIERIRIERENRRKNMEKNVGFELTLEK